MRTIKVSEEVWQAIGERGKLHETDDQVLRRILGLPETPAHNALCLSTGVGHQPAPSSQSSPRIIQAKHRMRSYVEANELHVGFYNGSARSWPLPARSDKDGIRAVREQACHFASEHGATEGQVNAVRKALTEAGYHLYR